MYFRPLKHITIIPSTTMTSPVIASSTSNPLQSTITIPTFDDRDPHIYFDFIDALPLEDTAKLLNAISNIPFKAKQKARHLLTSEAAAKDRFAELRTLVTRMYSKSQEEKLANLIAQTSMGDQNARDFLDYIRRMLPNEDKNSTQIRYLFFKNLPPHIAPMARFLPDQDLDEVAKAVDRSLTHSKHNPASANVFAMHTQANAKSPSTQSETDRFLSLELKIEKQFIDMRSHFEQQLESLQRQITTFTDRSRSLDHRTPSHYTNNPYNTRHRSPSVPRSAQTHNPYNTRHRSPSVPRNAQTHNPYNTRHHSPPVPRDAQTHNHYNTRHHSSSVPRSAQSQSQKKHADRPLQCVRIVFLP